jgi:hypothetical protein
MKRHSCWRSPGRNSNQVPPECKSHASALEPTWSLSVLEVDVVIVCSFLNCGSHVVIHSHMACGYYRVHKIAIELGD